LFALYGVGILFTDGWRNGVDFVTSRLISLVGGNVLLYTAINLSVLVTALAWWRVRREKRAIGPGVGAAVLAESALYASFMGGSASALLFKLGLRPPLSTGSGPEGLVDAVVLSIGAGTYEELVFRLLLLGGAAAALGKRWGAARGGIVAVLVTSLLFSACHYVPLGLEPWQLWSFAFRFVLGCFLAALFLARGFAVAVYTHTLYDLFILVPASL
jgi:membrane protease YdiL (CAAX protease family)